MKLKNNNIYLCGFMGSGKSTIGPILANVIGYKFIDLDDFIIKKTGKNINTIFTELGEEKFREIEYFAIEELIKKNKTVIALGGGTIQSNNILNLLKQNGLLIYLNVKLETLIKRLKNKTNRPILLNKNGEKLEFSELQKKISDLYLKRKLYYEKAELVIPTDITKVGKTVDNIVKQLSKYL